MKVLQANKFFYVRGGAERYFLDLVKLLPRKGIEVAPFSMQDPKNDATAFDSYFVSAVDYRKKSSVLSSGNLAWRTVYRREARTLAGALVDSFQPEVAHLHNIHHQLTGSILDAFSERDLPVVQTLHDYQWVCPVYTFLSHGRVCESCKGGHFFQAVRRRCQDGSVSRSAVAALELWLGHRKAWINQIRLFLAPSRFLGDKMIEHGIPPEKIRQINYCLNLDAYQPGQVEREKHFLYAGRLSQEKGVETLVEALEFVPDVHLRIAGSGPWESQLRALAEARVPGRVTFLGHLSPHALHRQVASAAVVVVPSEWYENQPFAVLESFALETPVVGADIGGIPELVRPGQTGWLFPPGDAAHLGRTLEQARTCKERGDLGKNARRLVEAEFDPNRHVQTLSSIYREVAA